MAPLKNKRKKGKSPVSIDIDQAVSSIVNDRLKDLLGASVNSPSSVRGKRLSSERDDDDDEDVTPPQKQPKQTPLTPAGKPDYASQVVILENVDESIKKHPSRLSEAFTKAKPNVTLRPDGLRMTASGDILVKPKNPKDCNSLLKENAFPATCALGSNVKARVPKGQQVTHQVIIKNVDVEVTQDEMDEILSRQNLPFKSAKRIHSRQLDAPTKMIRLVLKDEDTKKKLLRDGINLDQMHYKCVPALEDSKTFPKVLQCFKCQQIGDHHASSCTNEQKCVLCSGPHRKSECKAKKESFKCANCDGTHASWSHECPRMQEAIKMKKTPTMAQVASATVTPAHLQQVIQEIKESIVLLITEVVSRSMCELVYEIQERNVSKLGLPLKVATIATCATNAANKLKFGPATLPIDAQSVKEKVVEKCFQPKTTTPEAPQSTQKAAGSKSS